jgi:hypothetical protein
VMTYRSAGRDPSSKAELDFNRYDSEYFLTVVWDAFTQDGRQVPPTAHEKELAKRGVGPVVAAVPLAGSK